MVALVLCACEHIGQANVKRCYIERWCCESPILAQGNTLESTVKPLLFLCLLHEYHTSHTYVTPTLYLCITVDALASHRTIGLDMSRIIGAPMYSGVIRWGALVAHCESKKKEKLCPVHW